MPDEDPIDPALDMPISGTGLLAESSRVEAFSDGVLAIAITLLVLDLKIPDGAPGTVGHRLIEQWAAYLAYLASFIYIGVIWVNHHVLFTRIRRVNSGVLWRNLALLLAVSILPFPTATLAYAMQYGTHTDQFVALALYGGIGAAMALTWLIMFSFLDQHRDLLHDHVAPGFFREERRRAVLGIVSPVIAVAIGLVLPALGLVVFLLLPVFYGLTTEGWTSQRRRIRRSR
jgi:uncharacterized membrane protein